MYGEWKLKKTNEIVPIILTLHKTARNNVVKMAKKNHDVPTKFDKFPPQQTMPYAKGGTIVTFFSPSNRSLYLCIQIRRTSQRNGPFGGHDAINCSFSSLTGWYMLEQNDRSI